MVTVGLNLRGFWDGKKLRFSFLFIFFWKKTRKKVCRNWKLPLTFALRFKKRRFLTYWFSASCFGWPGKRLQNKFVQMVFLSYFCPPLWKKGGHKKERKVQKPIYKIIQVLWKFGSNSTIFFSYPREENSKNKKGKATKQNLLIRQVDSQNSL
jgi:hypothetical protein